MAKKDQRDSLETALREFDPRLQKLGIERFLSGEQIFDPTTKKLRRRYQDLTKTQLRGVLVCAQLYAKKLDKEQQLTFRYKEKRLLARILTVQQGKNGSSSSEK